jgi:hypothetical protein
MAATHTRGKVTEIHGFIEHASDSEIPGFEVALDRLIGELICAFFIAMAVMWIVTSIAGIFA